MFAGYFTQVLWQEVTTSFPGSLSSERDPGNEVEEVTGPSSETQGQLVGARESRNGRKKKFGEEK